MGFLLTACNRDKDVFTPDPLFPDALVTSDISGQIVNALNQPVEGATVSLDLLNKTTDENGYFRFENIAVNARRTLLQVTKEGYFENGRAIIPNKANETQVKIQLLEKNIQAVFNGEEGETIMLPSGVVLEIPDNAVLAQNGVGYLDQVDVLAHALNPEKKEGLQKMPADLKGINSEGKLQLLESYGMFLFEWNDANQEKLNIVPGKKVAISFPISNNILAGAPETIALWHYDNVEQIWKEEGTATLQNGGYVVAIGKTGFWNYSLPHDFVSVKGVLRNENNQVLSNVSFRVEIENGGVAGFGYVDEEGRLGANVPKDLASKIIVLDECNDIDYSAVVGALNEDVLIGNVQINNSSDYSFLRGVALDCNENSVQNGYVTINVNTKNYLFPISNGTFKGHINACDITSAILIAYDVDYQKKSNPVDLEIVEIIETGEISVCF